MKQANSGEYPRWLYHPTKPPLKVLSEVEEATAKEYRRAPYPPVPEQVQMTPKDQIEAMIGNIQDLIVRVTALENVPPAPPKKAKKGD